MYVFVQGKAGQEEKFNSSLEWKETQEVYGSKLITFPETAKEILISSSILTDGKLYSSYAYIPVNTLSGEKSVYGTGGYCDTESRVTRFLITKNSARVVVSKDENGNQIDTTYTTLHYR